MNRKEYEKILDDLWFIWKDENNFDGNISDWSEEEKAYYLHNMWFFYWLKKEFLSCVPEV